MSDTPISRRHLVGAGLLVAAGGAGVWSLVKQDAGAPPVPSDGPAASQESGETFGDEHEAIRGHILAALPFLTLPRATVDAFLAALTTAKRVPRKADQAVRLFLLSTDFFAEGADESRPLRYARLYDPYRNPCYNPMEPA